MKHETVLSNCPNCPPMLSVVQMQATLFIAVVSDWLPIGSPLKYKQKPIQASPKILSQFHLYIQS